MSFLASALDWAFQRIDDQIRKLYTTNERPLLLGQTHLDRGCIEARYIGFYRYRHRQDGERVAFFLSAVGHGGKRFAVFHPTFEYVALAAGFGNWLWHGYVLQGCKAYAGSISGNVGASFRIASKD